MQEQLAKTLSANEPYAELVKQKESAEQAIAGLLSRIRTKTQLKLQLAIQRQEQQASILSCLMTSQEQFANSPSSSSLAASLSVADVKQHNSTQLQASSALSAAFADTQKARNHLQQCVEAEKTLLSVLKTPLQQAVAQSFQLVQLTASTLQNEDPARELRHTEMMLRYGTSHTACPAVAAAP